ncbi:MAG: hypothetical protein Q4C63_03335 [Eubacteriales bacterium]|nr:hypothetical protein [Eubacteriales bacterium]
MLILQLALYCLIFTGMVRLSAAGGAINCLYFYPKDVQDRAIALGLTDRGTMNRKKLRFMPWFYAVMLISLVLIVGLWNGNTDFKSAYWQTLLFLEVMNWYDGVGIDRFWVGHSPFWILPGTEDLAYVQTGKQILKKRGCLTVIMFFVAAVVSGIVALLF